MFSDGDNEVVCKVLCSFAYIFINLRIVIMHSMKRFFILLAALFMVSAPLFSQKIRPREFVLPVALIGAGAVGSQIDGFKELDFGLRDAGLHFHHGFVLEDAVQYAPIGAFYALNMCGMKSAHSLSDGTVLVAASYCITAAATYALKLAVDERRPNGVDFDAFTSGHAAVSFMGAELLRMEYKDSAPWVGYAGYAAALYTSMARIKHSEHWFHDLVAGAGVGILGTRLAYLVCVPIHKHLLGKISEKHNNSFALVGMPFYNGSVKGVSLAMVF